MTQYFSQDGLIIDLFDDRVDDDIICTDLDLSRARLGFPPFHLEQSE